MAVEEVRIITGLAGKGLAGRDTAGGIAGVRAGGRITHRDYREDEGKRGGQHRPGDLGWRRMHAANIGAAEKEGRKSGDRHLCLNISLNAPGRAIQIPENELHRTWLYDRRKMRRADILHPV